MRTVQRFRATVEWRPGDPPVDGYIEFDLQVLLVVGASDQKISTWKSLDQPVIGLCEEGWSKVRGFLELEGLELGKRMATLRDKGVFSWKGRLSGHFYRLSNIRFFSDGEISRVLFKERRKLAFEKLVAIPSKDYQLDWILHRNIEKYGKRSQVIDSTWIRYPRV